MTVAATIAPKRSGFWAYTAWDALPALAGIGHFAYVVWLFFAFPHLPGWTLLPLGLLLAVLISWNINGLAHNFLHNRFFRWKGLNWAFSLMNSIAVGFSQTFYEAVHRRHHMGNSDLPDAHGHTIDPLSIYRHGHDGEAENVWRYVFCSYFRDDPKAIFRDVKRLWGPVVAWFGVFEIVAFIGIYVAAGIINWRFMLFFLPFYYLGHCLSYLNGFYLHYGANPDVPIAWGVSSYQRLYNWTWFNAGFHAEHHFRPKVHWTKLNQLHEDLREKQERAGTRVIAPPHALGFLDARLKSARADAEHVAG